MTLLLPVQLLTWQLPTHNKQTTVTANAISWFPFVQKADKCQSSCLAPTIAPKNAKNGESKSKEKVNGGEGKGSHASTNDDSNNNKMMCQQQNQEEKKSKTRDFSATHTHTHICETEDAF